MKEIFDIKRFWALTVKFYREDMKAHLILVGIMAVVIFLCVGDFRPFIGKYTYFATSLEVTNFINDQATKYATFYWGLFGVFSIFVAGRAFHSVMSRTKAVGALLVPASTFEKFLLAILHAVVFVFLVSLPLFYASASLDCANRYVGVKETSVQTDRQGDQLKQEVVNLKVGNVFKQGFTPKVYVNFNSEHRQSFRSFVPYSLVWLWLFGMFLWGSVTFRRNAMLLVVLSHFLMGMVLLLGVVLGRDFIVENVETALGKLVFFNNSKVSVEMLSVWFLLLYLFPVAYFVVTWRKFRNKQV